MPQIFKIQGFTQYLIIDKTLFKIAKKCKHKRYILQYRNKREIKICVKNNIKGYYLEKQGIRKFYPLKKLKHKLKRYESNNY